MFAGLARDWKRILSVAIVLSAVAFVLASLATPYYRAETRLLIDTRESVFTRPRGDNSENTALLDEEGVVSQVEIITSTDILKRVAKDFDLASLPEFERAIRPSLIERFLIMVGLKSNPADVPAEERVLEAFRDKLTVFRVERSRVIAISFSSRSPKLAADIPNAIADTYLAFSRDAKSQIRFGGDRVAGTGDRGIDRAGEGSGGARRRLSFAVRPADRPEQFGARHATAFGTFHGIVAHTRQPGGGRGKCGECAHSHQPAAHRWPLSRMSSHRN